jgi:hypothetical protein
MSGPVQVAVPRIQQPPFLPPEPPPGSVISWQQQFAIGGPVFTYVAVHIAGRGWYVTDESETAYSWPLLIQWLIGTATVFVVTSWGQP